MRCLTYRGSSSGDLSTSAILGKNLLKIIFACCLIGCCSGESRYGSGINLASGGLLFSCKKILINYSFSSTVEGTSAH